MNEAHAIHLARAIAGTLKTAGTAILASSILDAGHALTVFGAALVIVGQSIDTGVNLYTATPPGQA
jgi:hypothetical protein